MNQNINISVPCCHNGKHYKGITVRSGVSFDMVDNCSGGKALQFSNTQLENPPTPNVGAISAAVTEDAVCDQYLQLFPVVADTDAQAAAATQTAQVAA
jgi:hypothetical protein